MTFSSAGYRASALCLFLILPAGMVSAQTAEWKLTQKAAELVGGETTLCGLIVEYQCRTDAEPTTLLSFEEPLGESDVAIEIAPGDRPKFGLGFEWRHLRRNICATGTIEKSADHYRVRVSEPSQLTVASGPPIDTREMTTMCDRGVVKPTLVKRAEPRYTDEARRREITGWVLLEAVVQTDGRVGDVRVLHSLDALYGLDDAAIKSAREWRMTPATLDGRPVPIAVTLQIGFGFTR